MPEPGALYEIQADAARGTVWVTAFDGSCIGRFSKRFGIDVHTTSTAQLDGESQCLMCTHKVAGREAWLVFIGAVRQYHRIDVPPDLLSWP